MKKIVIVCMFLLLLAPIRGAWQSSPETESVDDTIPPATSFFAEYNPLIAQMIQMINESVVETYIQDLSVDIGPRVTESPASTLASTYLYNEFTNMSLPVTYDPWTYGSYSDRNVEAVFNGTNASSDEIYIVCGHFDTVSGSPGADDNAAGTAAVMTAAQILSQYRFEHTIKFVAFSGEEQGLLGSEHYANEAATNGDNIIAVLNADMIGYTVVPADGESVKIYANTASLWITNLAANISSVYPQEIGLTIVPSGSSSGSDHYYFWQEGFDAIFYHEYRFNDYYHSSGDTIAHMNLTYDAIVTRLVVATLAELAIPAGPPDRDVGIEAITDPLGNTTYPLGMHDINATVTNFGVQNQTYFNVSCAIIQNTTGQTVFTNIVLITSLLHQNDSTLVNWQYNFENVSQYRIKVETLLAGDQYSRNNAKEILIGITGVSHTYPLYAGWNLITISTQQNWTAETLGQHITNSTVISKFDAATQSFTTHICGVPWDNFPIEKGVGYFVYLTSDETLTTAGWPIATVSVPVYPGWNILGWYQEYNTTAESLGDTIPGCSVVLMFDAPTQTFTTHVMNTPWDNFTITKGMGLFIYTLQSGTWYGTG